SCGHREKHPLGVRSFECANCGTHHQRDLNAALNIKARALPLDVNVSVGKLSIVQEAPLF
ncbi:MAG: zinc ribbon domain-containing protein, partial [Trueperaceae bacterium]